MTTVYPPLRLRSAFFSVTVVLGVVALVLGAFGNDLGAWAALSLAFLFAMELKEEIR